MHYPPYNLFQKKAREGNIIPVYREIMADKETPVSTFLKTSDNKNTFLLENVTGDKGWRGRYSLLGVASKTIFRSA